MFIRAADLVETVLRGVALDERIREREKRVCVCVLIGACERWPVWGLSHRA